MHVVADRRASRWRSGPGWAGRPSTSAARRRPRYDGRKSWPHWDTQWASSTANSENFTPSSVSCTVGEQTDSGVMKTSLIFPSRTASRSAARSLAVRVESMRATGMPSFCSLVTWSSIRASSGETTSVGPWQHQRRQLVGHRLAAAGRQDRQRVPAGQHRFHDRGLAGAQLAEAEDLACSFTSAACSAGDGGPSSASARTGGRARITGTTVPVVGRLRRRRSASVSSDLRMTSVGSSSPASQRFDRPGSRVRKRRPTPLSSVCRYSVVTPMG